MMLYGPPGPQIDRPHGRVRVLSWRPADRHSHFQATVEIDGWLVIKNITVSTRRGGELRPYLPVVLDILDDRLWAEVWDVVLKAYHRSVDAPTLLLR